MKIMKPNFHASLMISFLLSVILITHGSVVPKLWADASNSGAQIPFDDANIFIEFNSTDEDVGIQVSLDGEPWRELTIVNPNGIRILKATGTGSLRIQGLAEFFFESSEPSLDEVPLAQFLARFPVGVYTFLGTTTEGDTIEGTDTFTHAIPDGPSIVSPEKNGQVFDLGKAIISWDPVTTPAGIEIVGYEVIVSGGNPSREVDFILPATSTRVRVPREVLQPGKRYEFEVLAKEVSGNQTITSGFFKTAQ